MSSMRSQTILGRLPVLVRSASSLPCAACSCAGNESAGSMLSLVRTALLNSDAWARQELAARIASAETSVRDSVKSRIIGDHPCNLKEVEIQNPRLNLNPELSAPPQREAASTVRLSIRRGAIVPVTLDLRGIDPVPAHVRRRRDRGSTHRSGSNDRTKRDAADERAEIRPRCPDAHRTHHDVGAPVNADIAIDVSATASTPRATAAAPR